MELSGSDPLPIGALAAAELAECVFCFEPLPSGALCLLHDAAFRRVCRHLFHLECMRADAAYVRRHRGRRLLCPLCNTGYAEVVPLPARDTTALFTALAPLGGGTLPAAEAKELLKAMLWLDVQAVEGLVDNQWPEAVGHCDVASSAELTRLIRMAGSCAGRMVDARPPLLVDDPAGWFDFWAADKLVLTRDSLVRALIKTLGTSEEERDELRAAVAAVWGLFCSDGVTIKRDEFVVDDGMADALVAALAGPGHVVAAAAVPAPPPGFWACPNCTLHNPEKAPLCAACERPAPTSSAPPSASPFRQSGGRFEGTPSCHNCGTELKADRVPTEASTPSDVRCHRCRRRPPPGAAFWSCGCSAALCVRCATLAPNGGRRTSSSLQLDEGAERTHTSDDDSSVGLSSSPSPVQPAPRLPAVSSGCCQHCHRFPAPTDGPRGRRTQWCQCIPGESWDLAVPQPAAPAAVSEAASAVPVAGAQCENCRRPSPPENWEGMHCRRWCQCRPVQLVSDPRETLRARQLLRATSAAAASRGPPEEVSEEPPALDVTFLPEEVVAIVAD
eukprot:TRINITY_DN40638_c0_g1_i1.p1 TRINITY_DN40638_c0_g1~~TRINITY_DN40638_c0_g1_i1.p1  ORF type:complete len:574 (+),score=71.59 TRINITY_DN40638_c0_g1_i1:48-1724(+)